MGTNTGTVMTIANSIIGVSVLAMPFCFKQCGIVLSILMLILSSILTRLTCYLLLKSAVMSRRRNFEFLAFHIFGTTGKFLTELCIIGYLMGTCIAFFVIVGDLGPEIIAESLEIKNSSALRPSFMIGLAILVILPLGLLRNVDSLSSVCIATIGFYFCLVIKVFFEALPHLLSGIWLEKVHYWRPAGVLQCLPIFSGALFCQMQLFEIYESLPNPSLERMNAAVHAAINMCTGFYISVGFLGYVAFCTQAFGGNILMSFLPTATSDLFKFGFVLSLAVSFPLVIFPCRASLHSLLYKRVQSSHHDAATSFIPEARFKVITGVIIAISLAVGLVVPNIELVLGLVGSTIGVAICVMFPALAFICVSTKVTADRITAQFLVFVGVLILVLGTYATLNAASGTEPLENLGQVDLPKAVDDVVLKLPAVVDQVDRNKVEAQASVPRVPAVEAAIAKPAGEPVVVQARREPPVPQEPGPVAVPAPVEVPVAVAVPVPAAKREEAKVDKAKSEEVEVIHKDALKKEDEELADAEKQAIGESHRKNVDVLRQIEKNKEEQEKLLQEQKKIIQVLQKESAKKAESVFKMKDLQEANEVRKLEEKVDKARKREKVESLGKVVKPAVVVEGNFVGQQRKESAIEREKSEFKSGNEGLGLKPAVNEVIANPVDLGDAKPAERKDESVPQPFAYKDQLMKNVVEKSSKVPSEGNKLPRNMTIKSIIMPNFANKIPVVRADENSNVIPVDDKRDLSGNVDANPSINREIQFEVDKIVSADILKNVAVERIDEGKANQRDILAADEERHEREKREATAAESNVASSIEKVKHGEKMLAESNLVSNVEPVKHGKKMLAESNLVSNVERVKHEETMLEDREKDCVKRDGLIPERGARADVVRTDLDLVEKERKPIPDAVELLDSGLDALVKTSDTLSAPLLVGDKINVESLASKLDELSDTNKPMTRDLKSVAGQNDGKKNITATLASSAESNEKMEI